MSTEIQITVDLITSDALFILHTLANAEREQTPMHVRDARESVGAAVTLNFNDYVRFLKQHALIEITPQYTLRLTEAGVAMLSADTTESFTAQVQSFFSGKIGESTFAFEFVPPAPGEFPPLLSLFRRNGEQPATLKPATPTAAFVRGEVIGRGPTGRVVRARNSALHFEVAMKELRPPTTTSRLANQSNFEARVKREVSAQARVLHPSIVVIHDLDLTSAPTIVSELCPGGNLRERVMSATPPSIESLLQTFMQLLDALAMAEAEGLSHGNIKPENVLFDRYGNAKLADFGLSRLGAETTGDQIQKDIRTMGALLYTSLTKRPHNASAPFASRVVSGLPAALDWVLDRMTTEEPKERYKSAAETQEAYAKAIARPSLGEPGRTVVLTAAMETDELPHEKQ